MTPHAPLALITGGSRGLGRSTALKLAEQGCDVIVTYLTHRAEAEEVVNWIRQAGRAAAALPLNAADSKSFDGFAADLREALQHTFKRDRFTYLVNNAGTGMDASFAETTEEQFDQLMNVHLKGVFFLTQKLLPLIADGGRIVNISSGLTRFCFPGKAAYGAMKGGVEVLSRYMAKEDSARAGSRSTWWRRARSRPILAAARCATTRASTNWSRPSPRWAGPACRTTSAAPSLNSSRRKAAGSTRSGSKSRAG